MPPRSKADKHSQAGSGVLAVRTSKDWNPRMPDEPENTAPDETPEPEDASQKDSSEQDAAAEPEAADGSGDAQPDAGEGDADEEDAPSQEQAEALAAAMAAVSQVQGVADSASTGAKSEQDDDATPFQSPELSGSVADAAQQGIDLLSDVHMNVRIELGRTRMYVEDVLKLGDGAVVELDKLAGDPVDVFVNDRRVAKGEVLVLNDMFCVRINELVDITAPEE